MHRIRIKYSGKQEIEPEDILEKALSKLRGKRKQNRVKSMKDAYLNTLRKYSLNLYDRVMEAMVTDILDALYGTEKSESDTVPLEESHIRSYSTTLSKGTRGPLDTTGLVLVQMVIHDAKRGSYNGSRWKNPDVAAEKAAKDLGRAYGAKMTEKTPLKIKGTNRTLTIHEIAETMADKQIETNIQDYIIQNFEPANKTKNQNVDGIKLYAYNWDRVDMANIGFKAKDSWLYHTRTHAKEFNLGRHDNEKYLAIIREMVQKKPSKDVTIYTNGNARMIYEESTNTFVKLVGGGVRTMFKPRRKINYVRDEIADYKSNFEPEPREER